MTTTGLAKIFVQNTFCNQCTTTIKNKMVQEQEVRNVILYPSDSLVVFNFKRANQLSGVMNMLTALGYPPKGDRITSANTAVALCQCEIAS
ncbi:hypothetical protein ACFQ1M_05070 [Sungkyunkwania multivorans]|uniref:HMA domain-containing protein n=1 Tax=Sungkyunkwania multivorans TaxID=1173618 RepID=A0ABW3CWK8_9FLAO